MSIPISKDCIQLIIDSMNSGDIFGIHGYISRETGEVLVASQDNDLDIIPDEEDENYEERETEFNNCYVSIPQEGSKESYQDMIDFIETVEDKRLQDILGVATQGRGAFGRFKDVLRRSEYELERSRWFGFSGKREYDRTVEWLTSQGFCVAEYEKSCFNYESILCNY